MERKCRDCIKSTNFGICTLPKIDKETCLSNESRPFWKIKDNASSDDNGSFWEHQTAKEAEIIERMHTQKYDHFPQKTGCSDCVEKPTCILEPDLCDKNQLFWDAAKTIERETKEAQEKENKYAPKERKNKPKPSLIPFDLLLKYLEPAYQEGLIRYYRESWRLGFPITDMYDSAMRHLEKFFFQKEDWDKDAEKLGIKKHHLGGVLFSVLCMLDTFENHPELDNRGKDWKEDK